ncbi:hypothetical protein QZH56_18010 [Streptomyces olivoreticuli]|uniref:hypothetical protein n=1 Tax=Streptomyces olivoreticuli TaxID=68246 RepID=UPI002658A3CC|nr:hypothetical protein [Streptomyces olivoreticuli]WKK27313.1 hypothetical protein QZH56_18010 [Streptomyces olivoreticuli]
MTETWTDHTLTTLRAARHTADGPSLVTLLRTHDLGAVLHQCGDALTAAVSREVPGARQTAARCAEALRGRGWPGDEVLAGQLETAPGGAVPMLRLLPVDLEELSGLLEGDPAWSGGRIDLDTGDCQPAAADDEQLRSDSETENEDRWLHVQGTGPRDAYRDMEEFITSLDDRSLARFLAIELAPL